ncbi:F-box/LRR-repeat protein 14-like [Ixodes scapularis]|uniref:F-box/LRR-repeat protein 14-like n=1 Tax=Ixodes scapularis TaxID=6945 RepID=UPI001C391881|nr:F-box/LRR-repeat protein 14-like [Ixodes scapularis]
MDGRPSEEVSPEVRREEQDAAVNTAAAATTTASIHAAPTESAMDTSHSNGRLYPEVLRLIFCYLDVPDRGRVAQVCRDWRDVADDRCVWSGVEAKLRLPDVSPTLYSSLNRRGIGRIKVVSFKGRLRELLRELPDLTSLDLSECYVITDSCIVESFVRQLTSLVSLNLNWCSQVTDVSVACITALLPNLEYLYLAGCEKITDGGMVLIAANLFSLKFLEIKECEISNVALGHLAGIGGNSGTRQRFGVSSLEYLGLEDCALVSDLGLEYLSLGLKHLVSLDLSMCLSVTDAGLEHIAKISSLKKLTLLGCEDLTSQNVGLSVVAEKLRDLTALNISECEYVSKDGISVVAANLRKLRFINMRLCTGLTNISLKHLARMSSLEVINLKGCTKITGKGMAFMASGQGQSSVLELDVSFTSIGDTGLRYIAQVKTYIFPLSF